MKMVLLIISIAVIILLIGKHYDLIDKIKKRSASSENNAADTSSENVAGNADGFGEEYENRLSTCLDVNREWTNNCDQKAGIILATIGVSFTVFLTSDAIKMIREYLIKPFLEYCKGNASMQFDVMRFYVFLFLVITALFASLSLWFLLNAVDANINYQKFYKENPGLPKESFIFYGTVSKMKYEEYKSHNFDYKNDLQSQVFTTAIIATKKFQNYKEGLFWFKMMLVSSAMLLVSVLFVA